MVSHAQMKEIVISYVDSRAITDTSRASVLKSIDGFKPFWAGICSLTKDELGVFVTISDLSGLFTVTLSECNYSNMNLWSTALNDEKYVNEIALRTGCLYRKEGSTMPLPPGYDATHICYEYRVWYMMLVRSLVFLQLAVDSTAEVHEIARVFISNIKSVLDRGLVWQSIRIEVASQPVMKFCLDAGIQSRCDETQVPLDAVMQTSYCLNSS